MGENSGIAWTTNTFNPWVGCTKVGPGCDHCYAESWNARFAGAGKAAPNWGPGAPRRRTAAGTWSRVRKWNRVATQDDPTWIFCASLADVFDNEADPQTRADLWALVRETPNLRWQFVTKRIGNAFDMLPSDWRRNFRHCGIAATVVTQAECDRDCPKLLAVKEKFGVTWVGLSIEPQLELVVPMQSPDWIITGGESEQRGARARPYDIEWARCLIRFGRSCGVMIFVKQLGSAPTGLTLRDRAGADPSEWPEDLRVRQMPLVG